MWGPACGPVWAPATRQHQEEKHFFLPPPASLFLEGKPTACPAPARSRRALITSTCERGRGQRALVEDKLGRGSRGAGVLGAWEGAPGRSHTLPLLLR